MIKVPLAIGIAVITLLGLCGLCWAAWKLRHCMRTKQIFATLEEILVENRRGLKKDAVRTFPIVKPSDLRVDTSSKLQCPICWLAFRDGDIMRQLPHCDHVFHRHCIDPVLKQQIICPVCGTVLTDSPKTGEELNGHRRRAPTSPTPPWVLVNRPVPLPRSSSSSSDRVESPLLKHLHGTPEDWSGVDLELEQRCIDISFTFGTDIPVEKRQANHSTEKGVDSFSFSTTGATLQSADSSSDFRSQLRRSRGRDSISFSSDSNPSSTRFSRSGSRSSRSTNSSSDSSFPRLASWEYAHPHLEDVAEHMPLTKPPEQCAFDVLPVITGSYSQL